MPKARWFIPAAAVAFAVILTLGVAGCDDDDSTAPSVGPGTYALVSVNGQALPFTVPNTEDEIVVQAATLTLTALGTYTISGQGTENEQPRAVLADDGTYTQSGREVTFRSSRFEAVAYAGTVDGNTLTITLPAALLGGSDEPLAFEFQK